MTHICVSNSKPPIISSDNGLSPSRRQAIIWTNSGILLIRTLGTNFSEIIGKIHSFSFKEMHLKMSSAKGRLFIPGLNELRYCHSFEDRAPFGLILWVPDLQTSCKNLTSQHVTRKRSLSLKLSDDILYPSQKHSSCYLTASKILPTPYFNRAALSLVEYEPNYCPTTHSICSCPLDAPSLTEC